jgi:hypothetical protein
MSNASPAAVATAICALVFTLLGTAYTIVGFAGGPDAFRYLGPAFLAAGLVLAAVTVPARARARAKVAAQTIRGRATVVSVQLHPHVRVGSLVNVTLTVQIDGYTVARRLNVSPLSRLDPGTEVEVVYDPADRQNFRIA